MRTEEIQRLALSVLHSNGDERAKALLCLWFAIENDAWRIAKKEEGLEDYQRMELVGKMRDEVLEKGLEKYVPGKGASFRSWIMRRMKWAALDYPARSRYRCISQEMMEDYQVREFEDTDDLLRGRREGRPDVLFEERETREVLRNGLVTMGVTQSASDVSSVLSQSDVDPWERRRLLRQLAIGGPMGRERAFALDGVMDVHARRHFWRVLGS